MKPGIIDIGSNSVRMAWLTSAPHYGTLPEERLRYSRFAEHATSSGALDDRAVARTIAAVQELLAEAQANDVEVRRISATSALREAANRETVQAKMEEALQRSITLLPPEAEARYSYEGAIYGLPRQGRTVAVLDVGGGSTELCWGEGEGMAASVPVGAVRLKEAADQIGPLTTALAPLTHRAPKGNSVLLVGVGGTLTTMAALFEGMQTYDPRMIHQMTYGANAISQINDILKGMPIDKRLDLPALTAGRADIITQGLDIALTVMHALETPALTVSTTDLLFGQLLELIKA
ncbi:MAG: hypothetical protein UDG94_12405 [Peptococcaceae bacterium]|nr:hypothetical protein [Peptococcaceae bacterium]